MVFKMTVQSKSCEIELTQKSKSINFEIKFLKLGRMRQIINSNDKNARYRIVMAKICLF